MTLLKAPVRLVFMGSPGFAVPALAALAERPDLATVVGVVCQPDKPAGRGQKLTAPAVKIAAQARGIAVFQPTKMKAPETVERLAGWAPDIAVVAAYGRILPPALLAVPNLGCLNIHASLLPRHRGASPINHAILAGDNETGVCIMQMDEGLDTGPIFGCRRVAVGAEDHAGVLSVTLATLGADLIVELLPKIVRGELTAEPQNEQLASYAPLLTKEDGRLNFQDECQSLERRIRAMHPWPGTFCIKNGQRMAVLKGRADSTQSGPPGQVLLANSKGVLVACGRGALWLDEVKPAGGKQMNAAAWVSGRAVSVGEQFDLLP